MTRHQTKSSQAVTPSHFIAAWMLLLGFTTALHAQGGGGGGQPLTCSTSVTGTRQLRGESHADLTTDIALICTGGAALTVGAPVPAVNITIFLNTAITSRTYANGWSEALLIVDEPGSSALPGVTNTQLACNDPNGICSMTSTGGTLATYDGSPGRPNIFPGVVTGNSVSFFSIPIDTPGAPGNVLTLRITNIRANAAALSAGPNASATPVIASIAVSNTILLPISNPTPTVGYVQPGLTFSVRTPDNSAVSGGLPSIPCSTTQRVGVLRFAEIFGTASKTRTTAPFADSNTSPAPVVQNVPGMIYNSESGFYIPNLTAPTVDFATVGLTDAGTRFRATFNNVPPGANVYVSTTNVTYSGGNPSAATAGTVARLIQNDALAFAALDPTTTLEGVPTVQLQVTNGSATAAWEVLATNPAALQNYDFVVWVQGPVTAAGTATVNGSYGPAPPSFNAGVGAAASSTLPLPRFVADPNPADSLFTAANCVAITAPVLTAGTPTYGNPLTFSSTVGPFTPPTSDTVTFLDGSTNIGTGNLNGLGVATVTTSSLLSAGSHTITARFNGDSNFGSQTSAALNLTVAVLPANATVTSPSVTAGQTVAFGTSVAVSASFTASNVQPASIGRGFRPSMAAPVPALIASGPTGTATFTDSAGSASCQAPIVAGTASCTLSGLLAGPHTISVSGGPNFTLVSLNTLSFSIAKAVTSTSLTASANAPSPGQNVTLTATINPGGATPGGTVSFTNGGNAIGGCSAVPVTGVTAACVVSFPSAGVANLAAAYSGDANTTPSSATLLETISNPTPPSTSLSLSPSQNPATVGQSVTFTVTVSGSGAPGTPTGSVEFRDGSASLGTIPLTGGQARVTTTFTIAGSHSIVALYGGDSTFPGSSSTFGILVVRAATSLTLGANPTATVFGQSVTLTANLGSGGPAGLPAPSGQVQFLDGTALLGSVAVAAGTAAVTVSNLIAGTHQLTAVYTGDATWSPSRSTAVMQTVSKAPTVITLTSSSGATQATLNSMVTAMSSVAAIPSGSVQFMDAATNGVLATATLAGGAATATVGAAGRMIVAVYSGDANFLGSRSALAAQLWIGNGASFSSSGFAANEIVTLMGVNLAVASVSVTDGAGAMHPATVSYSSAGQINFVIPGNLPSGPATVTLTNQDGTTLSVTIAVAAFAPGIFTAGANGKGTARGLVLDVQSTGVSTLDTTTPISLNSTSTFYLELFGTGFDSATANQVTVTINGQSIPVLFAGPQQQYAGLDQINVGSLPANLRGAGTVDVVVSVNGQSGNTVTLTFQ